MDYLFLKLWPFLACAFVLGLFVGYLTTPGENAREDR